MSTLHTRRESFDAIRSSVGSQGIHLPMWGAWPANRRDETNPDMKLLSGKLPPWAYASLALIIGFASILISTEFDWRGILRDTGVAFLVAGLLTFSIEWSLRNELVQDVFKAALGYVLPPELKDEVSWVIGAKFLCEKSICTFGIEHVSPGVVKLTTETQRDVKNITGNAEKLSGYISIDDWGFAEGKSEILEVGMKTEDGKEETKFKIDTSDPERISAKTAEISIRPAGRATLYSKCVEFKRTNDSAYFNFNSPSVTPEIEMKVPDDIAWRAGFTHRKDKETEKLRYSDRVVLPGTLLPKQYLIVRWWPWDGREPKGRAG